MRHLPTGAVSVQRMHRTTFAHWPLQRVQPGPMLAVAILLCAQTAVRGQATKYQIDETQSIIRIVPAVWSAAASRFVSGTRVGNDQNGVYEQSPGSLQARLSGFLIGSLSGSTLSFNDQSSIVVGMGGPYSPPPGSPGIDNFGGEIRFGTFLGLFPVGDVAGRGVIAGIASGMVAIGSPAPTLQFYLSAGFLDYELLDGTKNSINLPETLEDAAFNLSSQPVTGDVHGVIRIPFLVDAPFEFDQPADSHLVLEGLVVASRIQAIAGDFNGDGVVNGADLAQWRGDFALNADSDADGDGDADGADFLVWQRNLGASTTIAMLGQSVPEPCGAGLSLIALAACSQLRPARITRAALNNLWPSTRSAKSAPCRPTYCHFT